MRSCCVARSIKGIMAYYFLAGSKVPELSSWYESSSILLVLEDLGPSSRGTWLKPLNFKKASTLLRSPSLGISPLVSLRSLQRYRTLANGNHLLPPRELLRP